MESRLLFWAKRLKLKITLKMTQRKRKWQSKVRNYFEDKISLRRVDFKNPKFKEI